MNAFQKMIDDVFAVPQFREYFYFQGKTISCISYEVSTDPLYAEYGVEDGITICLTCKISDYTPKKGDKISFRNKQFKVDSFTADSFNLTYKIFFKDVKSK